KAFMAYKSQMEGTPAPTVKSVPATKTTKTTPAKPAAGTPAKPAVTAAKGPAPTTTAAVKKGFRIQLLSWKTRMDRHAGRLSLLSDVQEETADGQYYYFTGTFATQAEAARMLPEIKNLGFKTAVIVPADGRQ
ncbi:MAG: hypothetical protein ABIO24_06010, partial [Saprospiraceae bacterium]